jgi:hypothetical protein
MKTFDYLEESLSWVKLIFEGEDADKRKEYDADKYPKTDKSEFVVEKFVNGSRIKPEWMGKCYFDTEDKALAFMEEKNKNKKESEEYFLSPLESLEDRIKKNYSKVPAGNKTNTERSEVFKKLAEK